MLSKVFTFLRYREIGITARLAWSEDLLEQSSGVGAALKDHQQRQKERHEEENPANTEGPTTHSIALLFCEIQTLHLHH